MKLDWKELEILKAGTILYGAVMLWQIVSGSDHHLAGLALPALTALALWRPRPVGWHFVRSAFFVYFLYYGFGCFRAAQLMVLGVKADIVLQWGGIAALFLAAAVFVNKRKPLFATHSASPVSRSQTIAATGLAVLLIFLPWLEQTAWNKFDSRVLDNQIDIRSIRFSPDGKKLGVINYGGRGASIHIWDVESKQFIPQGVWREGLSTLAFSPDGQFFAVGFGSDSFNAGGRESRYAVKAEIWEAESGKQLALQRTEPVAPPYDAHVKVRSVEFSPDGGSLACASGNDKMSVELWDIRSGKLLKNFDAKKNSGWREPLAFSPDGRCLATEYARGQIAIWDIAAATPFRILAEGHFGFFEEFAYSPDGKYLAAAFNKTQPQGYDKGFIDLWDIDAGRIDKTLQWDGTAQIMGLSYSPSGKYIAAYQQMEDTVTVWDAASGKIVETLTGPVYGAPVVGAAYSPDGRYLAVASGQYIKLYRARE